MVVVDLPSPNGVGVILQRESQGEERSLVNFHKGMEVAPG